MKIFNIKRKKASLEISMNAIVILVLAIAMLGLGLTFIRGIFKGITAKVEEAVSAGEIVNPPTRDTPITITPSTIEMRAGETKEANLAFINKLPDRKYCELVLTTEGPAGSGGVRNSGSCTNCLDGDTDIIHNKACLAMEKDQINLYTISIDATSRDADTYFTTFIMHCHSTEAGCTGSGFPDSSGGTYQRDVVIIVND